MPEVLRAAVMSRSMLPLQEEEECPSLYKGKEEKCPPVVLKEQGVHDDEKSIPAEREEENSVPSTLCEEPRIDQLSLDRPQEEAEEDTDTTSMEDITMGRDAEEDSPRRSMVEEDSSRRGSLLDELREEEEMRLRLLQVTLEPILRIYLPEIGNHQTMLKIILQEDHVQRVEEQAMREAVWEEECRRQREESRWEEEMKRQEERRRRWQEDEEDELLRPKQELAQPPPQILLMPRVGATGNRLGRSGTPREGEEEEKKIQSTVEAREDEKRERAASMEEDGKREKRREAAEELVDDERRRRAVSVEERRHPGDRRRRDEVRLRGVSVDETPPSGNWGGSYANGQRLRGVSLDERTEGEVEEEEGAKGSKMKDMRVPNTIGVDQRMLVPAPEVKSHCGDASDHQGDQQKSKEAGRRELMKSLEDEERFLLERREVFEEDLQMRKTSHSRTTERHRDSTGERRKSGRRVDSEEKLRRDSSEGKNISRTSRSQSSERILEGKSSHSRKSSESRSASSERILKQLERLGPSVGREPVQGIYVGEYQNQSWVFVGEITSVPREVSSHERRPLQRSASQESTASEKDFSKAYQAITHRMVHRKSSAIMYSRILERTFECNKTVLVHRFVSEIIFTVCNMC